MQFPSQAVHDPHASATTDPRGRAASGSRRSVASRAFRVARLFAAGFVILAAVLYVGLLMTRWTSPEPVFEDPAAYIDGSNCGVSPDGKTAYLFLQHPGMMGYRDSVWAVDLETFEKELLPDAALKLHPLLPANPPCIGSVPAWDGRRMLGVLQLRDTSKFFSTDLATGSVEPLDWAAFDAACNHAGWQFDRIRPLHGGRGGTVRASRAGDAMAEPFMLDTHREPAVASADPMQIFYTASDGTVHHHDAQSGTDVPLNLFNKAGRTLRVSPDARWLTLSLGHHRSQLYEVATGRSRLFEHSIHELAAGERPVIHRKGGAESRWTLSGLDEDVTFVTAAAVGRLLPVEGGRFLGIDAETEAAYLLDAEGGLLATLRGPTIRND